MKKLSPRTNKIAELQEEIKELKLKYDELENENIKLRSRIKFLTETAEKDKQMQDDSLPINEVSAELKVVKKTNVFTAENVWRSCQERKDPVKTLHHAVFVKKLSKVKTLHHSEKDLHLKSDREDNTSAFSEVSQEVAEEEASLRSSLRKKNVVKKDEERRVTFGSPKYMFF